MYKKELVNSYNLKINFVAEEFETLPEEAEIEKESNEAAESEELLWNMEHQRLQLMRQRMCQRRFQNLRGPKRKINLQRCQRHFHKK